jgi:ornithine cyclodeaminase/alanine dehydrogenase-like protein (mu-crystallin family)
MMHITEEQVVAALPVTEAIRLVEDAWRRMAAGEAVNQPRRRLALPTGAVLHQLAGAYGGYFGVKVYSTHVKYGAHFTVLLYDARTAAPLARIDANHLGQIRTGAATGVAVKYLARPDAAVLAVIGTGFQARTQVAAVRAVRTVREVRVWSRKQENREAFAREVGGVAAESAEAAVRGADLIVTATYAKDPVLEAAWVEPGAHVSAVGSNNPQRRELPADLIARAGLIAVDALDQARIESGDLLLAWTDEDWQTPRLCEMKDVVTGARARAGSSEVTIFKSNGLGVQDIAVAGYVYEQLTRGSESKAPAAPEE